MLPPVRVRVPPHTVFGEKVGMATLKKTVTPTVVSTVAGLGLAMLNLALTVPPVSSSAIAIMPASSQRVLRRASA